MARKYSYNTKLDIVRRHIEDNYVEAEDVVNWLGLTIEEVMDAFQDKLVEKYDEVYYGFEESTED